MIARQGLMAFALAAGLLGSLVGIGQEEEKAKKEHTILTPADLKWGEGPDALPPGAGLVVMEGDPKKPEVFHMRLKVPAGYRVAPHRHTTMERVTVISGTVQLGLGEEFDESKMKKLPAGTFFSLPPKTAHFVMTSEETVIQISTTGPWEVTYVNRADDPRLKAK